MIEAVYQTANIHHDSMVAETFTRLYSGCLHYISAARSVWGWSQTFTLHQLISYLLQVRAGRRLCFQD